LESDLEIARKKISDYAMALDLLAMLSHSDSEKQAIANIIEIFTVLFLPKKVHYFPVSIEDAGTNHDPAATFSGKYAWTQSEKGFWVKIHYQKKPIGIVEVDEISFQEYKEQYLNLALAIVEVCGLVIANARKQEQLKENEQKLRREKEKAEQALAQVRQLSGLLPICMHCKKIRDDKGYWNKIEAYIQTHSEAEFSHGICDACLEEFYPDY